MKKLLASLIGCLLAAPAAAGPDFTSRSPKAQPLAASPSSSEIGPLADIVFETNSTRLSESARAQLASAASWMKKHRDHRIVLEGYADSVGAAVYNEDLAMRRAFHVRQQLIGQGVAPDRIVLVVYGERGATGGEHPLDRRVVMYGTKLSPDQIATASIERKDALSASWTRGRALFTQTRRAQTGTVVGSR